MSIERDNKRDSQRAWRERNREHVRAYNREYRRRWRAEHREQYNASRRQLRKRALLSDASLETARLYGAYRYELLKRRTDEKLRVYYLWSNAKQRAQRRGLPFEISRGDIVIPEVCPLCAQSMANADPVLSGHRFSHAASLDQIIAGAGYTVANTWVVCRACNAAKNAASPDLMLCALREAVRRGLWSPPEGVDLDIHQELDKAA